jgi:hypothetical protein
MMIFQVPPCVTSPALSGDDDDHHQCMSYQQERSIFPSVLRVGPVPEPCSSTSEVHCDFVTVRARGARVCGRGALTRAGPECRAEAQALGSRAGEPGSRIPTASRTRRVVTQAAPEGVRPAGI